MSGSISRALCASLSVKLWTSSSLREEESTVRFMSVWITVQMNNTGYYGKQLSYIKKKQEQLKIKNSSARWNMKPYIARKKRLIWKQDRCVKNNFPCKTQHFSFYLRYLILNSLYLTCDLFQFRFGLRNSVVFQFFQLEKLINSRLCLWRWPVTSYSSYMRFSKFYNLSISWQTV